jgi:hypothetical protein
LAGIGGKDELAEGALICRTPAYIISQINKGRQAALKGVFSGIQYGITDINTHSTELIDVIVTQRISRTITGCLDGSHKSQNFSIGHSLHFQSVGLLGTTEASIGILPVGRKGHPRKGQWSGTKQGVTGVGLFNGTC